MITRITLTNYMSHAHTVIEPAAGLTVILGPNNCGKSAIVSALQTLCGDNPGDFMVRHGEKECAVTVETDDGHTIRWQRHKKSTSYVLDGIEVGRTGRGNLPDDLQTLLRLGKVTHPSKDEEFDVHFGQQKSPIFLIDKEADTAAFFSTASDAEKLIEMQKLHKTKVSDRRRQLVETKNDLAILDARLTALSPLDDLGIHLESLAEQEKELEHLDQEIELLEELLAQTRRHEQGVQFHHQQLAAIAKLQSPPALAETDPLAQHINRLESARREVAKAGAAAAALSSLAQPPSPHDTKPLEEFLHRLAAATAELYATQSCRRVLVSLTPPPTQEDPAPLADFLARLIGATATKLQLRNSLDDVTAQLKSIEADIAAWLWANPNCPTCGQPTTREHFLTPHEPRSETLFSVKGESHA
jgi:DNA repair ATPase RecN